MIKIFYGAKGAGKTKKIIDAANDALNNNNGNVVYITDNPKHSIQINTAIRFIDTTEYSINNQELAIGFIKGVLASNNDITKVFIDGFARMTDMNIPDMKEIYGMLEDLSAHCGADFTLTVSTNTLPEFMKKYI